jgi:hypothetical protein
MCEWGNDEVWNWGPDISQMYRISMDHLPFFHWPDTASGAGYVRNCLLSLVIRPPTYFSLFYCLSTFICRVVEQLKLLNGWQTFIHLSIQNKMHGWILIS